MRTLFQELFPSAVPLVPACPVCGGRWQLQEGVGQFCTATCSYIHHVQQKKAPR